MVPARKKLQQKIALFAKRCGLLAASESFRQAETITSVNYHWTPVELAESFERHCAWYSRNFQCLNERDLFDFYAGGRALAKPGLVITFDDGNRNNHEVAAPLLERYGLTGWFFVIADACRQQVRTFGGNVSSKFLMGPHEMADLRRRGHVIGCHSATHVNLGQVNTDRLRPEIVEAADEIESAIGCPVTSFAYPFGTADSFSPDAVATVNSRYRLAFTSFPGRSDRRVGPHAIGRYTVETGWDVDTLRLRLSGAFRPRYWATNRRFLHTVRAAASGP